jgi:hypothetical protein
MPEFKDADLRLLAMLTWKVRVAADAQLTSFLGISDDQHPAFVRRLKHLNQRRFLERHRVTVALFTPDAPLVNWLPDLPEPDWQSVSWRLQHRWRGLRANRVWVNWATREAAAIVGGVGGRLRQPLQLQHDLAVTAVYIARQNGAPAGDNWLGEDAYRILPHPKARMKIPDALIVDQRYRAQQVIELGGLYSPSRLKGFHRYWAARHVPYEIW